MDLRKAIIPIALPALLAAGCGTSAGSVKRDNLAYLYGKGSGAILLSARVYHVSKERSEIHFKLPTRDLLYKGDGTGGPFRATVRIGYEAYSDWNSKDLLDSASVLIQDVGTEPTEEKELVGKMPLEHLGKSSFVVKFTARDLNRESQSTTMLRVERGEAYCGQFFLPIDPGTGVPLFDDHLLAGQDVLLRSDQYAGRTLTGTFHRTDPALPVPVFTSGSAPKPPSTVDSSFTLTVDSATSTVWFAPSFPGTYDLRPDTATQRGCTFHLLNAAYPFIANADDLLRPLRYITSMQEYDRMSRSDNVRQAVERFWLDAAGDRERARDAIRIYYGRVENANRHFTSHVEGWRTDRGLVHIIFGIPNTIYRSEASETWIYGEENNLMSLTFTFTRRSGPFSDNDLVLQRDPMFKGAWYRNVESWRNGRVYQN